MGTQATTKKRSTAAFLLLPGFSGEGFSHIVPVFVRLLAVIFVQAGLIPPQHPSTLYGAPGVEKVGAMRLLGEVWFSLRTNPATVYQWGLFSMVVLMMGVIVVAVATTLIGLAFGLVSTARAQLFELTNTAYYGSSGTGFDAVRDLAGGGAFPIFDTRYAPPGDQTGTASYDYALMVLDKVLRQGMVGSGGTMQNALGGVMQLYNSAVLVVAAIILFWIILSIVVDTAKTGVVGGGRHNMVWAPIRIIFGLGIMIPLGVSGFSSGQYMVVKMAEWGSNLGSNAWTTYITAVSQDQKLYGPINQGNVLFIADGIARIKLCQAVYNAYTYNATHVDGATTNSDAWAAEKVVRSAPRVDLSKGEKTVYYRNSQELSMCGAIITQEPLNKTEGVRRFDMEKLLWAPLIPGGVATLATAMIVQIWLSPAKTSRGALSDFVLEGEGGGKYKGVYDPISTFACGFAKSKYQAAQDPHPVDELDECRGVGAYSRCYDSAPDPDSFRDPDMKCHREAADVLMTTLRNSHSASVAELERLTGPDSVMLQELEQRGWGGMGLWMVYISELTKATQSMNSVDVNFVPGTAWGDDETDVGREVTRVMEAYTTWWNNVLEEENINPRGVTGGDPSRPVDNSNKETMKKDISNKEVKALRKKGNHEQTILQALDKGAETWFMFSILAGGNDHVYPMAEVVAAGHSIRNTGLGLITGALVLEVASGIYVTPAGLGFRASFLADSSIMSLVRTAAMTLIMCGLVIGYYLPVLPLIRVTYAVLTWIISVFEAVCMVPIAGLAHLTTEGEGLAGGARQCWLLWLNILLRPVLVVLGFIGALLVYNTFVIYFHASFSTLAQASALEKDIFSAFVSKIVYSIIYMSIVYTSANVVFKMLDTIPDGMVRWIGGSQDKSFDMGDNSEGMLFAAGNMISQTASRSYTSGMKFGGNKPKKDDDGKAGVTKGDKKKGDKEGDDGEG